LIFLVTFCIKAKSNRKNNRIYSKKEDPFIETKINFSSNTALAKTKQA
jgi:hypothetical protein